MYIDSHKNIKLKTFPQLPVYIISMHTVTKQQIKMVLTKENILKSDVNPETKVNLTQRTTKENSKVFSLLGYQVNITINTNKRHLQKNQGS